MDRFSAEQRSKIMRKIRSKDTGPEKFVRSLLHSRGYRFRLHQKNLPGTPDVAFPLRRKVIFIHGCFWHQHGGCTGAYKPATQTEYWEPKLKRNVERDQDAIQELHQSGWAAMVVWECELADKNKVVQRLQEFLGNPRVN